MACGIVTIATMNETDEPMLGKGGVLDEKQETKLEAATGDYAHAQNGDKLDEARTMRGSVAEGLNGGEY